MKRLVISVIVVFTITILGSGLLFSQPVVQNSNRQGSRFERMHNDMGMYRAEMLKKLNLTEGQKEKIASLKIDFQKKMVDLRADLQKNKLDLKDLRVKGNFNRNDVISSVENINKSKNAIALAVANHLLDVYEVLTPEQQKIWQENSPIMNGRMHRGKKMMQHKW